MCGVWNDVVTLSTSYIYYCSSGHVVLFGTAVGESNVVRIVVHGRSLGAVKRRSRCVPYKRRTCMDEVAGTAYA